MNSTEFVHLHTHTAYSMLDGAIRIPDLAEKAIEYGMKSVAITDHGNMFGAINFYQTMKKNGIKPIVGCEVYITPGDRRQRKTNTKRKSHHLVLLAKNLTGYKNLVRLVSKAYLEGFYYNPRIDYELLETYHEGLIGLSACLGGEIPAAIMEGSMDKAREIAGRYSEILGKEHFYLEVQRNELDDQDRVNTEILAISKELNLPLVATNDCHYLEKQDKRAHDVLLCIQTGSLMTDENRFQYTSDALYFRPGSEMIPLFTEFPGATENTIKIAEMCNLELELGNPVLPTYQTPAGESLDDYLDFLAKKGLEDRIELMPYEIDSSVYFQRLEDELSIIKQMGFSGYFLIVSDFIRFAHESNIPVGPGRGSGAGSLVAYSLKIIDLDPIPYNLLFERFLNPERVSMPDFDIDFCMNRREEVIRYVAEKYGQDKVGQIITFNCMKAKAVIRDVGRVLEIPLSEVDRLAKLIPNDLKMTIDKALSQEKLLKDTVDKNAKYRELFEIARRLEGLNRHAGVHAAGVVISEEPLWETVPVKREGENEIVTQYAKDEVEKAGLVKFDFLGLKTLTVIDVAQKLHNEIRKPDQKKLDVRLLAMDHPKVFDLISSGCTSGVFQMESSGFQEMIKRMKPSCFEDIIAAVALYRPGPMDIIPDFIARKHGEQSISYPHDSLKPILEDTYGLIVYQEQVMQISQTMAGFSLGHADLLRRAMGKKKPEEMAKMRKMFLEGDQERGIPGAKQLGYNDKLAGDVFDLMEKFAGYGFNKSHAAGYAVLSYQTAYLKCFHPREFMAALMTCDSDKIDKVVKAINECRSMDIKVLPPDVNTSGVSFTVVEEGIRFGLAAVKNVGIGAVEATIKGREEGGRFRSIFDFCKRVDLKNINRRVIESLIKCGAFDSTGAYRSQMMEALDSALSIGQKYQHDQLVGQINLFELISESSVEGMPEPELPQIKEWITQEKLQKEKETLGFYITGHPLLKINKSIRKLITHDSANLKNASEGQSVIIAGIVSNIKRHMTKTKEQMAFATVEDLSGLFEVIVRPKEWTASRELLEQDNAIIIFRGSPTNNDTQVRIVAEDVMPWEQACRVLTRNVSITLNDQSGDTKFFQGFRTLLENYRGEAGVHIVVDFPEDEHLKTVTMNLGNEYKIDPCEGFIQAVQKLTNVQAIEYW